MFTRLRPALLLIAALAMATAPCLAVPSGPPSCPMAGCGDSPGGSLRAAACCCERPVVPADPGPSGALMEGARSLAASPAAGLAPTPALAASGGAAADFGMGAGAPDAVPLYLLNASLLI